MRDLIIIGAGGHAKSCIDVVEDAEYYKIQGVIGFDHEVGRLFMGYPIIGTDRDLDRIIKNYQNILIGVGQIKSPNLRLQIFNKACEIGFSIPTIVSKRAYISKSATIGIGTIVMHGAIVNSGAVIGQNCIINSGALIEHDAIVGSNCHISTMATLNGGVQVGDGVFVGSCATIKHGVKIGANSLIGMSANVKADIGSNIIYP